MASERILVVDDADIVCIGLKEELGREGYRVDYALSCDEAVRKVRARKYDVIFVDLVMPGKDGIQTCREIRAIRPESKVVFITGQISNGLEEKEKDFMEAGGRIYYLYKPFSEGEILEATRKILSDRY
jgi:DNA-binding response OmpR family regulator